MYIRCGKCCKSKWDRGSLKKKKDILGNISVRRLSTTGKSSFCYTISIFLSYSIIKKSSRTWIKRNRFQIVSRGNGVNNSQKKTNEWKIECGKRNEKINEHFSTLLMFTRPLDVQWGDSENEVVGEIWKWVGNNNSRQLLLLKIEFIDISSNLLKSSFHQSLNYLFRKLLDDWYYVNESWRCASSPHTHNATN